MVIVYEIIAGSILLYQRFISRLEANPRASVHEKASERQDAWFRRSTASLKSAQDLTPNTASRVLVQAKGVAICMKSLHREIVEIPRPNHGYEMRG